MPRSMPRGLTRRCACQFRPPPGPGGRDPESDAQDDHGFVSARAGHTRQRRAARDGQDNLVLDAASRPKLECFQGGSVGRPLTA